jgi:hypothetical protein
MLQRQLADDLGRVDSHRIDAAGLVDAAIDVARQISGRAVAVVPATADERNERDR